MAEDSQEFTFIPPPEAPVFEPTEEEFQDPLAYIERIRPYAEKTGLCKIRPPPDWQPPFSVDVENFRFTPRIQRLNELEARTRVKLNFLDYLAKFWELQGNLFKIPVVERKSLDLFRLYKTVHEYGGYEFVTRKKKWSAVARKMGFLPGKSGPTMLRVHYEKILYPYDVFVAGAMTGQGDAARENKLLSGRDKDYLPHGNNTTYQTSRKSRRTRVEETSQEIDYSSNPELKKLQFLAPGPKMSGLIDSRFCGSTGKMQPAEIVVKTENSLPKVSPKKEKQDSPSKHFTKGKGNGKINVDNVHMGKEPELTRRRSVRHSRKVFVDSILEYEIEDYVCHVCSRGTDEDCLLLCDGCDDSYHTFCLIPPLLSVPRGDWRCPRCIAEECNKPQEAFGFEQAKKEYTLQSFGEMADSFKREYFKMPPEQVPTNVVEKEFWRLVSSMDEEVLVEYGADLHTFTLSSGFPKKGCTHTQDEEYYANSPWNLNNLANLEKSVLSYINADISGMKVPWIYVGMCFSSFCWHNEDHWTYSINYMHWGEPKTWYGVPGPSAPEFEKSMRDAAPELFEAQPDLLHQLVTLVNPNDLISCGVPVVRTNQYAGEFVVTFPRAYHAGFNHGYNLAEAVNFATADWLPIGRNCIEHYRVMARAPVFSHEELVCKMAADPDSLDLNLAKAVYDELKAIVDRETKRRVKLIDQGMQELDKGEAFELLPDDERQCFICKTTCFLSLISCQCRKELICGECVAEACSCSPSKRTLRYRYTLQELPSMLLRLKRRADSFDNWATEVKRALDPSDHKVDVSQLKDLVSTAEQSQFPDCDLLQQLKSTVTEAERCASVAVQLVSRKHRTRHASPAIGSVPVAKLTLDELQAFMEQLNNLPCSIHEAELVQELMTHVESFQCEAQKVLHQETNPDLKQLQQLLDTGSNLDVELPEIPKLKQELRQAKWLEQVNKTLENTETVSFDVLRELTGTGATLSQRPAVARALSELRELVALGERWEEKAKLCLQARPRHVLATVESIVQEASNVPIFLPNVSALKEALRKSQEWSEKVDQVQNDEYYPYLEVLEALVMRGRPIPVRLDQLPQMESQVAAARAWRDRAARTFLKKNTSITLLEVLSARKDIGVYKGCLKPRKKRDKEKEKEKDKEKEKEVLIDLVCLDEYVGRDPAAEIAEFKEAEKVELSEMHQLRAINIQRQIDEDAKRKAGEIPDGQYCVCRRGPEGFMLQCELCKDWFHGSCVPLPRTQSGKSMGKGAAALEAARELKYLCPLCLRSRRPRLETILSLLVSLQKLPVRLPEGEALQYLTERAMNWQDRARHFLSDEEVATILSLVACNRSDSENKLAQNSVGSSSLAATAALLCLAQASSLVSSESLAKSKSTVSADNKSAVAPITSSVNDVVDESDKVCQPAGSIQPFLSEVKRRLAEDLMMEGDLLEVTLDETDHLWRLLQSQRSNEIHNVEMIDRKAEREKPKRKRKKKAEEGEGCASGQGSGTKSLKVKKVKMSSSGVKSITDRSCAPKKRRQKDKLRDTPKVSHQEEEHIDVEEDDDDDVEDEDDTCAAKPCSHPSGDEVGWVQCDHCQEWYHLLCVSLRPEQAEEMDAYSCPSCTRSSSRSTTTAGSPESENIDVDSTTPNANSPTSPAPPITIFDPKQNVEQTMPNNTPSVITILDD